LAYCSIQLMISGLPPTLLYSHYCKLDLSGVVKGMGQGNLSTVHCRHWRMLCVITDHPARLYAQLCTSSVL